MAASGGAAPPRTACAAVYGDGTFQISEMNWGGPWNMHYRTLTNLGQYWFVH